MKSPSKKLFIFEIFGLLFFALAIFWFFALISYSEIASNLVGPTGAAIAKTSFNIAGFMAYVGPLLLAIFACRLIFSKGLSKSKCCGLMIATIGFWPILAVFSRGGIIGDYLESILIKKFSYAGLWIIGITFFLLGLIIFVGKPILANGFRMAKKILVAISSLINVKRKVLKKTKILKDEKKQEEITIAEVIPTKKLPMPEKLKSENKNYDLPSLKLQFDIAGKIREIRPGPVVTSYEFVPNPGIKLSKIAALSDDIAMAMSAVQVRIVTPIPGKGAVGIEVPNLKRETVYLKEIIADVGFQNEPHKLCMALGKDVEGRAVFMNLADMPHVLIAGTTGSGKSVSMNAMICSILFRATPEDVRLLMIDPKMLEFSIYQGIPHLLLPPIIDPKKAANALAWAVKEMESRYELMKEMQVRDIEAYNMSLAGKDLSALPLVKNRKHGHLPYIVIVVDEYADLVAVSGKEVEHQIMRLAQKARASGIHVMLATQRPSVDIITGVIKANFPVRMGFRLASMHDSKTIINRTGAEKLLGKGDGLVIPPGTSELLRVHGCLITEKEISKLVAHWKNETEAHYDEEIAEYSMPDSLEQEEASIESNDQKLKEAIAVVKEFNKCSVSFLQRKLQIGYNRAARMVEEMEQQGLVGPAKNANKGDREIFINKG